MKPNVLEIFIGLLLLAAVVLICFAGCGIKGFDATGGTIAGENKPHTERQQEQAAASQSATATDHARINNSNAIRQDNRNIEGQPPPYTFWNAVIDKLMLLIVILNQRAHGANMLAIKKALNGGTEST